MDGPGCGDGRCTKRSVQRRKRGCDACRQDPVFRPLAAGGCPMIKARLGAGPYAQPWITGITMWMAISTKINTTAMRIRPPNSRNDPKTSKAATARRISV
jgi:hypothetical protein